MTKFTNPTKVITGPQHKIQLRKRLGSQVHQRRRSEVQRQPYYSEVRYQDGRED